MTDDGVVFAFEREGVWPHLRHHLKKVFPLKSVIEIDVQEDVEYWTEGNEGVGDPKYQFNDKPAGKED